MTATTTITTDGFISHAAKPGIVILDFWADWCGPCRTFGPIFEAAATRHPDIVWGKVDIDAQRDLAVALEIRSVPTLMVFRDGILLFEQPGVLSASVVEELVAQVRALDMDELRRRIDTQPPAAPAGAAGWREP